MTASPATRSRTTERSTAVVVAGAMLLVLVVDAFGSVVDAHASNPAVARAQNIVATLAVSDPVVVAPSQPVRPGECRASAPDYHGSVVGFWVAADSEAGASASNNDITVVTGDGDSIVSAHRGRRRASQR